MSTSLGLDIGTNSIGWCLYDGDAICDLGVRIFTDGRDPKSGASLAVNRRDARAMRRRRDRYLGRRSALLRVLRAHGLMPDGPEAGALAREDPYQLRARGLTEALTPYQLGRAIFHLNQRRGFKSNRKADRVSKDAKDGKIASGTKALDAAMAEMGAPTLGAYLAAQPDKRVRMRPEAEGYDFYPDRRHVEDEFDALWTAQAAHHPAVLSDSARDAIKRVVFHQRPLKAQEVGFCTFAGWNGVPADARRLPKAHPLFQQRRLYEEVNQLEIVSVGAPSRKPTLAERDALILKLQDKPKVSFDTLAKVIKLRDGERFNKQSENRKELIGDEVRAVMLDKKRFGTRWGYFSTAEQWTIIDRLIEETDDDRLLVWLTESYGLDAATAEAVANARLPEGHGRFGEEATVRLLQQLKSGQDANGAPLTYAEAALRAGFHHSDQRDGVAYDLLPYYGEILTREIAPGKAEYGDPLERKWGKITNPTVHIGLNQLRRVINDIVRVYGRPERIYVELARELKLNEKQKSDRKREIRENTDAARARSKTLTDLGQRDSGGNRMRLRIWQQLNPANMLDRRCPYCAEPISIETLMNGRADIDHIIPYSRCLDDGAGNKVVAHVHCNRQKGNRTPWEQWGGTDRWPLIQEQVARLHRSNQWRFGPDAMERVERDGGFIARQLTDTQYLSRLASKFLSSLYTLGEGRRVYAVTGRMTAMLRRLWGLNDLLPDHNIVENMHSGAPKNRLDHRHHVIDAAVVGATTPAMIQQIATAAARAEAQELDRLFVDLPQPWPGFREVLGERLRAVVVSHKPDRGGGRRDDGGDVTSGRLHNDTAYGFTGRTNAAGLPIVVTRKPLLALKPEDLTDPERMPDRLLQERLYEATRDLNGKAFEGALREFSKREGPYHGIRRVRLTEALGVIPISDQDGRIYKGVKGDANARFDVWRLPDGKWVTKWKDREGIARSGLVTMFESHQRGRVDHRPHPAAKKVLSLRQNDLVAIERGGADREIMRVVKFSDGEIILALHSEAGPLKDRHKAPDDPFRYFTGSARSLQAAKARQIRIDPLARVFDPGPRD